MCVSQCEKEKIIPYNFATPQFKSLLELAVKESAFVFNNNLYTESDGVAMGPALGPTLANAFLCFHEKNCLMNCLKELKPLMYKTYVGDCFLLLKDKNHVDLFLNYLNTKHGNIEFTAEHELNNSLPVLDARSTKLDNKLVADAYRKDTFTGLGLNFFSYVPHLFKVNYMITLIYRAYSICNSWNNFDL